MIIGTSARSNCKCFGNKSRYNKLKLRDKGDVVCVVKYDFWFIGKSVDVMACIGSGFKKVVHELGIVKGDLVCFYLDQDVIDQYIVFHYNNFD